MRERNIAVRAWVAAAVLAGVFVLLQTLGHGQPRSLHRPLRELPLMLGEWRGEDRPLTPRIVEAAGVDDYVNRVYAGTGGSPVGLYVGYYGSQKTGDGIHSPKNCLPGSGWEPVRSERLTVAVPGGRQIVVNEYLVEKGLQRQLVLYWYQAHGRVVASEYSAKFWMVADAITRNRTDGALVRVVTPAGDGEAPARARVADFARLICSRLDEFVPE